MPCYDARSVEYSRGLSSEALAKEDPSLKISDVMSNLFNKLVTTYPFITVIHR